MQASCIEGRLISCKSASGRHHSMLLRELFGLELRMHFSRLKSVLFVVYDQYFISPITNFI